MPYNPLFRSHPVARTLRSIRAALVWEVVRNPAALATLLAIARDKKLRAVEELAVREEVIELLRSAVDANARTRIRGALLMIVVDITDNARVRDKAAHALRNYGGGRTVEILGAQQARTPSAAIAETLRLLEAAQR